MKRKMTLFVLVGVVGAFGCVLAAFAASSSSPRVKESCCSATHSLSPVTARAPAKTTADKGQIVEELTAILKETKSPETFLVTAMVLGRMGPDAKRALPAIIRNAERLELLEDLFETGTADANKHGTREVLEAIEMILNSNGAGKAKNQPARVPVYYAPVTSYAPVSSLGYAPAPAAAATPPSFAADACPTPRRPAVPPTELARPKPSTSQWRANPTQPN